jgi:hypothetical protein
MQSFTSRAEILRKSHRIISRSKDLPPLLLSRILSLEAEARARKDTWVEVRSLHHSRMSQLVNEREDVFQEMGRW